MKDRPSRSDVFIAATAAWFWLAVVVVALLCSGAAHGATAANLRHAVCRVHNQLVGFNNVGSGTLIDKTDNGREGLVLTCAHLFREGTGNIVVEFADGKTHGAKLVAIDRQADLAALAIGSPSGEPAVVSFQVGRQSQLQACGYGPSGVYRCAAGPYVGETQDSGQLSLLIGDGVRSGDSGGGVFDDRGRLVAVIWGTRDGVTYASAGGPLRRFLGRVVRVRRQTNCPDGTCPLQQESSENRITKRRPFRPQQNNAGNSNELARRISALEQGKQDRGDYLTQDDLPDLGNYARQSDVERLDSEGQTRHESLLARIGSLASGASAGRAASTLAVGALGISGPAGWAAIAAGTVGGWLIGRRLKRRGAGGRRRRGFRG